MTSPSAFAYLRALGRPRRTHLACASLVLLATRVPHASPPAATRMAPVAAPQMTAEQHAIADRFASSGIPNAVATYLNHPALAEHILPYERYVAADSLLPPRHRKLLSLRTAWLTRSGYLWAHEAPEARRAGLSSDEMKRIAEGPDAKGWPAFEAALLRAADELHVDSFVSDATWQTLGTQYNINQLTDVVYGVGALTMYAGALNSLGVEIEPGIADRLPTNIPFRVSAKRTNIRLEGREPRIPPLDRKEWTPEQRQRFDPDGSGRRQANVFITFVRNPPADRLRGPINQHILNATTLAPRQRELLLMRIGVLCRSEYEWAAHSRLGRRAGMTDADVDRIVRGADSAPGDAVETALLRATDELYTADVVSDRTWADLARTFDSKQLLDVLISVGGYRMTSMAINSAGVQLDPNMADFRFPASLR
jgi:4-carboxymuconolactone decarboxylase